MYRRLAKLCGTFTLTLPIVLAPAMSRAQPSPEPGAGAGPDSSDQINADRGTAPGPAPLSMEKGLALARAKACMACHQVEARRVGPPFASVAKRYGSAPALTDYLATTIRKGGRGRWGAVPMPAQPQVSEEEAVQLAQWILQLPVKQ